MWANKEEVNKFWWCVMEGLPFVVFDVETTGIKKVDKIVQFSATRYEKVNGIYTCVKEYDEYIKPPFEMDDEVIAVHGITNEFLKDKPDEYEIFPLIKEIFKDLDKTVIAGYNVKFDIGFMERLYKENKETFVAPMVVDCMLMSACVTDKQLDLEGSRTLGNTAKFLGVADGVSFHSAIEDVKCTWDCMVEMLKRFVKNPTIPEEAKETASIERMSLFDKKWRKVNDRNIKEKRIYVNARTKSGYYANVYYDALDKCWRNGKDSDSIARINMEVLEKEAIRIATEVKKCKNISCFKGEYVAAK